MNFVGYYVKIIIILKNHVNKNVLEVLFNEFIVWGKINKVMLICATGKWQFGEQKELIAS
jgi:hypothetical protein